MTRAIIITIAFAALLHTADRVIAGLVQCHAAQTCPNQTPPGPTNDPLPVSGGNLAGGADTAPGPYLGGAK